MNEAIFARCSGLALCSFNVTTSVLGIDDPCSGVAKKWLMITATCDDAWRTQDYVISTAASAAVGGGDYTLSLWIYPGTKNGLQTVAAFVGAAPITNRALIQWKPDGAGIYFLSKPFSSEFSCFLFVFMNSLFHRRRHVLLLRRQH